MNIRLATRDDVPALVALDDAHMRESFGRPSYLIGTIAGDRSGPLAWNHEP